MKPKNYQTMKDLKALLVDYSLKKITIESSSILELRIIYIEHPKKYYSLSLSLDLEHWNNPLFCSPWIEAIQSESEQRKVTSLLSLAQDAQL